MAKFYLILADAILILHTAIVAFIIIGLILTWIGYFRGWKFVRNGWFRLLHLLAMGYVAVQTLLGADCPLTIWENNLRVKGGVSPAYDETFIGHWLAKILFFDVSLGTFAILYTLFFALVVFTWFWVKPRFGAETSPKAHRADAP
ncbi:MAG: DUF2784 domain-containing protein [Verrucomicrobia bacterium]|nr:DUF2784 domain-containing protein [Verrucomicrobiota bacterium]